MANEPARIDVISGKTLLEDTSLEVPDYQRIYSWGEKEIQQLWQSLHDGDAYHLGSIILYQNDEGKNEIVDGQQRLITLALILKEFGENPPLLLRKARTIEEENNIANALWVIENLLATEQIDKGWLKDKINNLQFTKITIGKDYPDLAYLFFNNQNSRGIKLSDYDLLKAHHLRFIEKEPETIHMVDKWIKINKDTGEDGRDKSALAHALGNLVYRLRKLQRKNEFNETGHYIRDEFQSVPLLDDIPAFIREITFDTPIQGGSHFFNFAEFFYEKFLEFNQTMEVRELARLKWRHKYLYEICECMLFVYFLKFGKHYLAEALFCILAILGQYRFGLNVARRDLVYYKITNDSNLLHLILNAQSPAFFFGKGLASLKRIPQLVLESNNEILTPKQMRDDLIKNNLKASTIKEDYYKNLCTMMKDLRGQITSLSMKNKIQAEYTL